MNLWQSEEWKTFQQSLGRETRSFKNRSATAQIVKLPLVMGLSYYLCQRGPLWKDHEDLEDLFSQIEKQSKKDHVVFTKISPVTGISEEILSKTGTKRVGGLSKDPGTTLIIDLTATEEEIQRQMKQKGRYNIRVAGKNAIEIEVVTATDTDTLSNAITDFIALADETTERNDFSMQRGNYYLKLIKSIPGSELIIARYRNKPVAAAILAPSGMDFIYLYGASSSTHRNVMAPYLIQWTAILSGKQKKCEVYDFLGIAETENPIDPWHGLTKFKKQFGGIVISYPKAIDIVYKPLWYTLYSWYKKTR